MISTSLTLVAAYVNIPLIQLNYISTRSCVFACLCRSEKSRLCYLICYDKSVDSELGILGQRCKTLRAKRIDFLGDLWMEWDSRNLSGFKASIYLIIVEPFLKRTDGETGPPGREVISL